MLLSSSFLLWPLYSILLCHVSWPLAPFPSLLFPPTLLAFILLTVPHHQGWKKRWCILYLSGHDLFLQYYNDEESARGNSAPKSTVSLRNCSKVDVDLQHSSYKNVFSIHLPERVYYFSSPSQWVLKYWLTCAWVPNPFEHVLYSTDSVWHQWPI